MKTYVFHEDAGHGWLEVTRKELIDLGILNKVSSCSYQHGLLVYLEEDCDAALFINALKAKGIEFTFREKIYPDLAPIRKFYRFSA